MKQKVKDNRFYLIRYIEPVLQAFSHLNSEDFRFSHCFVLRMCLGFIFCRFSAILLTIWADNFDNSLDFQGSKLSTFIAEQREEELRLRVFKVYITSLLKIQNQKLLKLKIFFCFIVCEIGVMSRN